jgi:pimeloyl-ACP methyl ester carboxylesterase
MGSEFAGFSHGRHQVDGTSLHYQLGGKGEPVVLLHGWPQHSLQWHAVAPRLAQNYQVLVPDLPGCGSSSIPRSGFDKETIAASIRSLVDHLGLGPVRLVGYDHGAGVAYNYAVADPEAVSHLAFVEYVLPGCGYERAMQPSPDWHTGSNWQLSFFTVPDVAEFAFRGRERELLNWFFWHGSCDGSAVTAEHLDEYVRQVSRPGALRAGIEYYAAVWKDLAANQAHMQHKLTMPAIGIGGSHNLGEVAGKAMSLVAESARSAVVEGAGHWVSDENPEGLSQILLDFFTVTA